MQNWGQRIFSDWELGIKVCMRIRVLEWWTLPHLPDVGKVHHQSSCTETFINTPGCLLKGEITTRLTTYWQTGDYIPVYCMFQPLFPPQNKSPHIHLTDVYMGPRSCIGILKKGKFSSPCWDLNTAGPVQSPVTILTTPSQLNQFWMEREKWKLLYFYSLAATRTVHCLYTQISVQMCAVLVTSLNTYAVQCVVLLLHSIYLLSYC